MILCCGEALIDMIPTPTTTDREGFVPHSGGAVFNTAIALGRLGVDAGFFSGISNDLFGAQLISDLEHSHVATRYVARSDRPTTLAFVQLINGQARYAFYDENTAGRLLEPADLPQFDTRPKAFYFGGISLVAEPAAQVYAQLCQKVASESVVMIDPNIRQSFIQDEARYRARLDTMFAAADIIKVSDEDLEWISGSADIPRGARALMDSGAQIVLVTQGAQGAVAYQPDHDPVHVASVPTQVVDTVGAGDSYNAGFLASLERANMLSKTALNHVTSTQLSEAMQLAAKVASVTVSRAGANAPWADELT